MDFPARDIIVRISNIKLIRTYTKLDHSKKAEKGMIS